MSAPGIVQNLIGQVANQTTYVSWDRAAGAASYKVYRDATQSGTYALVATVTVPKYQDTAVVLGTPYYYYVTALSSGAEVSPNSAIVGPLIPAPTGEMSLFGLRQASQQKADRLNSQFVTTQEWNTFINLACNELYDLLITTYEDYFMAPRVQFLATGLTSIYPLPNGTLQFYSYPNQGALFTAAPFYKLLGVDLALQNANNAFVTINKYMVIDRNRFVYPNTASSIYGVFNLRYRLLGANIEFIPQPSGGQVIQLLYIPRLTELVQDTDITTIGFSGWLEYVICRAAKYALDKEESDTGKLDQELMFIQKRIEETAPNRDSGQPDRISDVRQGMDNGGGGFGQNGSTGGW